MFGYVKKKVELSPGLAPAVYWYKRKKRMRRIREAAKNEFPESIVFETTNYCNIACIKCPRHKMERPLGFMDFEVFKSLVDESLKYGKRRMIGLIGMGEATMHPKLAEMIEYMSENDAAEEITLNTNALLLDEKRSEALIKAGLNTIKFSVDASTPATYELLMQRNSFERFVGNIETFLATKEKLGAQNPTTYIRVTLSEENVDEVEEITRRWEGKSDVFEVVPAMNWAGAVSTRSPYPAPFVDRSMMGPCTELWHTMYIYQNGEVALCCVDWDNEFEMGDVDKRGIYEVWNNENFKKMRQLHLKGDFSKLPYCEGCNMRAIR
jgi:radical SAM protein with 4Fe4S-binding SPASM domain